MPPVIGPAVEHRKASATFAATVAKGTGLTLATVLAWMRAEGGPANNPLNIGPGRDYGSPEAAAQAVIQNLHTPIYAHVIAAAKQAPNDTKAQLLAIAQSPWDAGHYTGGQHGPTPGVTWGTTLLGSLAANKSSGVNADSATSQATDTPLSWITDPLTGWVGQLERWVSGQAVTALAYVVFTFLGITLVVLGLLEVFGLAPGHAAALVATGGRSTARPNAGEPGSSKLSQGDTIPF